jgi:hypothetical protein
MIPVFERAKTVHALDRADTVIVIKETKSIKSIIEVRHTHLILNKRLQTPTLLRNLYNSKGHQAQSGQDVF